MNVAYLIGTYFTNKIETSELIKQENYKIKLSKKLSQDQDIMFFQQAIQSLDHFEIMDYLKTESEYS